jgi:hypothetical protein
MDPSYGIPREEYESLVVEPTAPVMDRREKLQELQRLREHAKKLKALIAEKSAESENTPAASRATHSDDTLTSSSVNTAEHAATTTGTKHRGNTTASAANTREKKRSRAY